MSTCISRDGEYGEHALTDPADPLTCQRCFAFAEAAALTAIEDLANALRLTVEYVGLETLPPIEGWSWFDALSNHRPDMIPTWPSATRSAPTTAAGDDGEGVGADE